MMAYVIFSMKQSKEDINSKTKPQTHLPKLGIISHQTNVLKRLENSGRIN